MSQENVDLVRGGFDAFQEGNLSRMLDLMADDLVTYRADPDGATYHGREGFLRATADWTEGFSEWSVIPEEFIDGGSRLGARSSGRARRSQRDSSRRGFLVHLRDASEDGGEGELLHQTSRGPRSSRA
jgi:ketosteroid isomerase-like protein